MSMFLMRDEKEERKKQARSNKQTRQSNTAHPRQSRFLRKMSCLGWDSNPRHSILWIERSTTELPRQLNWLGQNLTAHSTPDEQANHQLSMKEKAEVTYIYMYSYLYCPTGCHNHHITLLPLLGHPISLRHYHYFISSYCYQPFSLVFAYLLSVVTQRDLQGHHTHQCMCQYPCTCF